MLVNDMSFIYLLLLSAFLAWVELQIIYKVVSIVSFRRRVLSAKTGLSNVRFVQDSCWWLKSAMIMDVLFEPDSLTIEAIVLADPDIVLCPEHYQIFEGTQHIFKGVVSSLSATPVGTRTHVCLRLDIKQTITKDHIRKNNKTRP